MVAFKILVAIALLMSTINRPCSADCKNIIINAFYNEFRERVNPECDVFCFDILFQKSIQRKIEYEFFITSSSELAIYSKEKKIELFLDYVNKIYNPSDMGGFLFYIGLKPPRTWCAKQATSVSEEIEASIRNGEYRFKNYLVGVSNAEMVTICLSILGRISINENATTEDVFKEFFENWTAKMLNYETIFNKSEPFLRTPEVKRLIYYTEKFVYSYYKKITHQLRTLEFYNTRPEGFDMDHETRETMERKKAKILSIGEYCQEHGQSILNN